MSSILSLSTLWYVMLIVYIPACLGLILVVLLQKGKGVGFGGAFGMGGGSDTIFGPRSSRSLPQQLTYGMAGIFMVLALFMSIISGKVNRGAAPELDLDPSIGSVAAPTDEALDTLLNPEAPVTEDDAATAPDAASATDGGNTSITIPIGDTPAADAPAAAPASDATETPAELDGAVMLAPVTTETEAPAALEVTPADPAVETPAEAIVETPTETPAAEIAVETPAEETEPAQEETAPAADSETVQ